MVWENRDRGRRLLLLVQLVLATMLISSSSLHGGAESGRRSPPYRILVDTDVDTDDLFALLYLLKLNTSEFDLKAVTINANGWSDAGHSVNHVYDLLHMMGRDDDVSVGVGGDGGILEDGTVLRDVGGFLPIVDQGVTTSGHCRYRQAIPVGKGGRLDIDTNFGIRKAFLPRGRRSYVPQQQPTTQQVMIDAISKGPTTLLSLGSLTNLAVFLMSCNPHLRRNVEHIYAMGGSLRRASSSSCETEQQCDQPLGNVFTASCSTNPYAEFNIFADPFAAHQVIHSGIPVTLIPLDATNTAPVTRNFLNEFERNRRTYEAKYCFESLKMAHDTWPDDQFFKSYFMWDYFAAGVATSIMLRGNDGPGDAGENDFCEMEYMNITVVTSNPPYGISDGSNPLFDGSTSKAARFGLRRDGVASGHVQTGLRDPFCLGRNGTGRCQDGWTRELSVESGAVRVLVATKAKPAKEYPPGVVAFDTEFAKSFLDVINRPQQSAKNFNNITSQWRRALNRPEKEDDYGSRKTGKPVIFDMDMSAGDFLALIYLVKVPGEVINLEAIFVTPTGWANAATIDVVYDLLHMMGRDDIPVGLGDSFFALNQSYTSSPGGSFVGDCKYAKAVPLGSGGLLDSDTLYGVARTLLTSPRRYTAENSVKYGAPRDTDHPELRQPLASEIWKNITEKREGKKVTILTNGPLTTLANIIMSDKNAASSIQEVFVVGGHMINSTTDDRGNVFTVPSNRYAEFNMFLDPVAAKAVFDHTELDITLIPLSIQRKVTNFTQMLQRLNETRDTPEAVFARALLSQLRHLYSQHATYYQHMDIFLGETLGAQILLADSIGSTFVTKPMISVLATGDESTDGQIVVDEEHGGRERPVRVLQNVDPHSYYNRFAERLGLEKKGTPLTMR